MKKYSLISVIGEGTYGRVFKARHNETNQIVAIKKFKESDDDQHVRKTALRQIRILKQLKHDNVVSLIQVFRQKGKIFLVFEYVEKTLLQVLEQNPNGVPSFETKKIMWQLVKAISFIHSHDIIHRDIKPQNLLLSKNGVLKICDFGFARVIGGPQSIYTDYVSTRWYRAPELLVGDVQYGKAVDVWAIGCQVVEFMTGYPLFPGESDIHTLYYIMKTLGDSLTSKQRQAFDTNSLFQGVKLPEVHDLESLQMKFPTFDSKTIDFIRKCLQLDPTNRRSCEELKNHAYFDNFREQIQQQLKESVKKDEDEFQFKALQAMQSGVAIQNTLIGQDYKNSNNLDDEDDGQQVEGIDNLMNNGMLNKEEDKHLQQSKFFGVQEEAVFGGSGMFQVPQFGKGLAEKKTKDPTPNGFGMFPMSNCITFKICLDSLAKKINYPQIYGSGSLFDTSTIQQQQQQQQYFQEQESDEAEIFRFKELLGNMCTSGTYILGKDKQILNSSENTKSLMELIQQNLKPGEKPNFVFT